MKLTRILFILLFIGSTSAKAQDHNIEFDHLTIKEGLSNMNVKAILKDSKGFMWFGTDAGLNKYDGYTFTVYKYNALNSSGLASNIINSLFEDNEGNLWVSTSGGLSKFDRRKNTFKNFFHNPKDTKTLSSNEIHQIVEDDEKVLWIASAAGINKLNQRTGAITRLDLLPGTPDNLRNLFKDQAGDIWIPRESGTEAVSVFS